MSRKKFKGGSVKAGAAVARTEVSPSARRFDAAQKNHALVLVASGMKRVAVAATIGTTTESLRRWVSEAEEAGTMPAAPITKTAAPPVEKRAPAPVTKMAVASRGSRSTDDASPRPKSPY